jgi:hypothetical protein
MVLACQCNLLKITLFLNGQREVSDDETQNSAKKLWRESSLFVISPRDGITVELETTVRVRVPYSFAPLPTYKAAK